MEMEMETESESESESERERERERERESIKTTNSLLGGLAQDPTSGKFPSCCFAKV